MHRANSYFAISLIVTLTLCGCAASQALQDMKQAKAAYKACLAAHPNDPPSACKHEKEAYEAAGEAYDGISP